MIIYKNLQKSHNIRLSNLIKKVADESNYYSFTSSDYLVSDKEQMNFIDKMNKQKNCYIQGAFYDDDLIGVIYLYGGSNLRSYHSCTLGIGVLSKYNDNGIGSNLMKKAISYAYDTNIIAKINVQVLKENTRAINFYKKFSFNVEGMEKRALFIDGMFYDSINLGKIIQ